MVLFFESLAGRFTPSSRKFVAVLAVTLSFALMGAESAFALCPAWNCGNAYAVGAKASYNGLDYTLTAGARGASCPGYTPAVDNWWSQTGSCSGSTPTATATSRPAATPTATATARSGATATATTRPRATATATSGGSGIGSIVSSGAFDAIWPPSHRNANYKYADFVSAAVSYPSLCNSGTTQVKKRECTWYFGNKNQETGHGRYDRELYCQVGGGGYGSSACNYCGGSSCGACAAGQQYWGRGQIQLSWDFNYCGAQSAVPIAGLHGNPNLMFTSTVNMWKAANWYWETQIGPDVSNGVYNWTGGNKKSSANHIRSTAANAGDGGAGTMRAINGAIECEPGDFGNGNGRPPQQIARIQYAVGTGMNEGAPTANQVGTQSVAQSLSYVGTGTTGLAGQSLYCSPN